MNPDALKHSAQLAQYLVRVQGFGPVANKLEQIEKGKKGNLKSETSMFEVAFNLSGCLVFRTEEGAQDAMDHLRESISSEQGKLNAELKVNLINAVSDARTERQAMQLHYVLSQSRLFVPALTLVIIRELSICTIVPSNQSGVRFMGTKAQLDATLLCGRWSALTTPWRVNSEKLVRSLILQRIEDAFIE